MGQWFTKNWDQLACYHLRWWNHPDSRNLGTCLPIQLCLRWPGNLGKSQPWVTISSFSNTGKLNQRFSEFQNSTSLEFILYTFFLLFNYVLLIMLLQLSQFFPLCPPAQPPTIVHVCGSVCKFFGCSISCTVLTSPRLVCDYYLYFLIPSPPHPVPHTPLPSGNHQNSVSMILSLFFFFS